MSKVQPDRWSTNPVQITSIIEIPATSKPPTNAPHSAQVFPSPVCGLGWRFDLTRNFQYEPSRSNTDIQEKRGRITAVFRSHLCTGLQFRNLTITVDVEFPGCKTPDGSSTSQQVFNLAAISQDLQIGVYAEPFPHQGRTIFKITVAFNSNDKLSFPTTISPRLSQALASSLDGQTPIDTKFYLFSAKVKGKAGRPRAVYGYAAILTDISTYMQDLLSDSGFQGGNSCDLHEDVPEVINRLKSEYYDYESDSDLESIYGFDVEDKSSPARKLATSVQPPASSPSTSDPKQPSLSSLPEEAAQSEPNGTSDPPKPKIVPQARAYAINGTAYQTWKAFVYYAYTSEIQFKPLRSSSRFPSFIPDTPGTEHGIACSPKSMYRLADYAGLPILKNLAKEGIGAGLSEDNVVKELFSRFTSKHDEIIEMEVDFFLKNFVPKVSEDFDDVIESIVSGQKPHCYRTLAFAIKRLHKEDSASAWASLKNRSERLFIPATWSLKGRGKKKVAKKAPQPETPPRFPF